MGDRNPHDRVVDVGGHKVWLSDIVALARHMAGPGDAAHQRLAALGVFTDDEEEGWRRLQAATREFLAEFGPLFDCEDDS